MTTKARIRSLTKRLPCGAHGVVLRRMLNSVLVAIDGIADNFDCVLMRTAKEHCDAVERFLKEIGN